MGLNLKGGNGLKGQKGLKMSKASKGCILRSKWLELSGGVERMLKRLKGV